MRLKGIVLGVCLALLAAGCASVESESSFKPGTYSGSAEGRNGPLVVEVRVDARSILGVSVKEHRETAGISDNAIKLIPLAIVKKQGLAVDSISGATLTSEAIKKAAAEALKMAGADLGALAASKAPAGPRAPMKPGTYYGEAYGKWPKDSNEGGRFLSPAVIRPIRVEVSVDAARIREVKVLSCDDTPGFKESAIARIPAAIVERQSLGVDAVTGSTLTSRGIISAATLALEEAGADILALSSVKEPKREASVEYAADVVVIGAGASGSAAALAAVEKGAKVLVLEKTGQVGGMGGCSTGFIGVGSEQAKKAGNAKTVQDVFMEMMDYTNWTANPILVKAILEKSGSTADWLAAHGYKMTIANASFTHDTGKGNAKIQNLYDTYILPAGGKLLLSTRAERLITEGGKVVGVLARGDDGTRVTVRAKAVIVATGGFGGNKEMLRRYTHSDKYYLTGLATNTGDGITMALATGAALSPELSPQLTEFAASTVLDYNSYFMKYMNYGGLLQVNREGKRFMDESLCASQPLAKGATAIRTAESFFVVLDQATLDTLEAKGFPGLFGPEKTKELMKSINWRSRALVPFKTIKQEMADAIAAGVAFKADDIAGLEKAAGFAPGAFVATVERYRAAAAKGADDEFYKEPFWLKPIEKAPYYAVRMEPAIFGTIGGIKVNERIEALDEEGNAIPGLFVAGQDGGGMYGYPYYEIVGVSQGYAYNSGRIAGENAAAAALR
ncbi:MAG TPA: FAD-binding protein [Spirochaetales bacterium]|nr:FAD-binding protein [Spirochaetales bacterium]HRZ64898.1 FAD-binding protein [Spirochaetia bacterium]